MSALTAIATHRNELPPEYLAVQGALLLLSLAVGVRRWIAPSTTGAWALISWQEAHAAVRVVARRRGALALLFVAVGVALYIANYQMVAIVGSGLALEALLATVASRLALRRIEQPQVGLGRRGGWLWVHGQWICCGESVLQRASTVPTAQSFSARTK